MFRSSEPGSPSGDRRLRGVKLFVVAAVVLVVAGLALAYVLRRNPGTVAASAAVPEVKTPPPPPAEPRLNEFLLGDRYVLEVPLPGAGPEDVRVEFDPLVRPSGVTIRYTPPDRPGDGKRRVYREEWQPNAFTRTVPLPDGYSPPEAVLRNGVLTLSFPRSHPFRAPIVVQPGN